VLSAKFDSFAPALVAAHGDLAPSQSGSGSSTPAYAPAPPAPAAKEEKKPVKESAVGNTATVTVEARLQASGEDIWGLLTDEQKIPMWARAPAKVCEI
jgi:activator of HSP90 ATPase